MSRWKRLSRKRRAIYAAVAIFAMATAAWAVTLGSGSTSATGKASRLNAPLLPPDEVFVQKTSAFGQYGNVLVTVQLTPQQLAAKLPEGTRDFIVIGSPEAPVILRDDGRGGDATARDGLFSGPAYIDDAQLQARAASDNTEFNSRSSKLTPHFVGRAAIGVKEPEPFDYSSFSAGQRVPLGPAVAFIEAEGVQGSASLVSSKGNKISFSSPVVEGTNPFQDRVLMIRDVGVVTDPGRTYDPCTDGGTPDGVWTFNHLMTEMANQDASGIDPSEFVERWLRNWADTSLTINAEDVPERPAIEIILEMWPKTSEKKLDLSKSPLRLLSINPRIDLRRTTGGGGYSNNVNGNFLDAGEARFIFGFVVPPDTVKPNRFLGAVAIPDHRRGCFALPFTVIFEYRIPKCDCEDVRGWARQWMALDDNANLPGTIVYNQRLQDITEQFVRANTNPRNPNGSSLGQLRTNEIAISPLTPAPAWELREFQLTQFPFTFLQETTVEDTPQMVYQNGILLRDWILEIKPNLSGPDFEDPIPLVPLFFDGSSGVNQNFMAGKSQVPEPTGPEFLTFFWNAPGLILTNTQENWARHRVSRAACSGCHRRETFTHFVHVDPGNTIIQSVWNDSLSGGLGNWVDNPPLRSNPSLPAELSKFLTGINNLGDPGNSTNPRSPNVGTPTRHFDDLARREDDIRKVANLTCFRFHPANAALVKKSLQDTGTLPTDLFQGLTIVPVEQRVSVAVDDMTANHISEVH